MFCHTIMLQIYFQDTNKSTVDVREKETYSIQRFQPFAVFIREYVHTNCARVFYDYFTYYNLRKRFQDKDVCAPQHAIFIVRTFEFSTAPIALQVYGNRNLRLYNQPLHYQQKLERTIKSDVLFFVLGYTFQILHQNA